jgi:hypothetical protein
MKPLAGAAARTGAQAAAVKAAVIEFFTHRSDTKRTRLRAFP